MPAVDLDAITYERLQQLSAQEELPVAIIIEHLVERYMDISHLAPFICHEHLTFNPRQVSFSEESIAAIIAELRNLAPEG